MMHKESKRGIGEHCGDKGIDEGDKGRQRGEEREQHRLKKCTLAYFSV